MRSMMCITGATGGLGKAFAVECARRRWDLFLTDLKEEQLEILASALQRTYGIRVRYQESNLMDPDSRQELFREISNGFYRFHGLINVAGLDVEGIFRERSRDEIRGIIRLNVEGTLEVTHSLLAVMDPMQPFRIITVSSLAAFFPIPVKATYAASKRFLLDFSLALKDEVLAQGATVTVLCPAGLPTTTSTIEAIEAQGIIGQLTTQNIGRVARITVNQALSGRTIVVPGFLNQVMRWAGSLIPPRILSRMLGKRWRAAMKNRSGLELEELHTTLGLYKPDPILSQGLSLPETT
ncbi:MAG: SDR family NAD(P)-dependent oxidoreductase [Anaerolineales bacterium]